MTAHDLRTSDEWQEATGIRVLDPDGWNRRDFERSWSERITVDEFRRRCWPSTLTDPKGWLTNPDVLTADDVQPVLYGPGGLPPVELLDEVVPPRGDPTARTVNVEDVAAVIDQYETEAGDIEPEDGWRLIRDLRAVLRIEVQP